MNTLPDGTIYTISPNNDVVLSPRKMQRMAKNNYGLARQYAGYLSGDANYATKLDMKRRAIRFQKTAANMSRTDRMMRGVES